MHASKQFHPCTIYSLKMTAYRSKHVALVVLNLNKIYIPITVVLDGYTNDELIPYLNRCLGSRWIGRREPHA
jgi:hypothetical protein